MKKNTGIILIVVWAALVAVAGIIFILTAGDELVKKTSDFFDVPTTENNLTERSDNSGEANISINFDNISVKFNGFLKNQYEFTVSNNNNDDIIIVGNIVAVKTDGTEEFLGMPAFYGIDEEQFAKDKEENGWAVNHTTNKLRAGQTLKMYMDIKSLETLGNLDPDNDGIYSVKFTAYHQPSSDSYVTYTGAPESEIINLKND